MKNRFKLNILIITFCSVFSVYSFSDEFIFNTSEINVSEKGNIIEATDGTVTTTEGNFTIKAEKFKIGGGDRVRSEIFSDSFKTSEEFWVSFSIFVPEDWVTISPTSVSMFQIWERNAGPNLMIEDINGYLVAKQQVLNRRTDKYLKGQNPWPVLIKINDMRGKWTHFKIHTRQSDKMDKGFYKYYIRC